jgi:NADH:ubiquinone oxidoreductase subunit 3 (subunit A)
LEQTHFVVPELIANAMAPVFLIAGIGSILNVIMARLARAVDRLRAIDLYLRDHPEVLDERIEAERTIIDRRISAANLSITCCVASILCVCGVVIMAFLNPLASIDFEDAEGILFIIAMLFLATGTIAFLHEVLLASRAPRSGLI